MVPQVIASDNPSELPVLADSLATETTQQSPPGTYAVNPEPTTHEPHEETPPAETTEK